MDDWIVETKDEESGEAHTRVRCKKCGKAITDIEKADALGHDGKMIGFFIRRAP